MIWWIGGIIAPLVGYVLARNLSKKGYFFWRSFILLLPALFHVSVCSLRSGRKCLDAEENVCHSKSVQHTLCRSRDLQSPSTTSYVKLTVCTQIIQTCSTMQRFLSRAVLQKTQNAPVGRHRGPGFFGSL